MLQTGQALRSAGLTAHQLLLRGELDAAAYSLYLILRRRQGEAREAWGYVQGLRAELEVSGHVLSKRTVQRHLGRLVALKLVDRIPHFRALPRKGGAGQTRGQAQTFSFFRVHEKTTQIQPVSFRPACHPPHDKDVTPIDSTGTELRRGPPCSPPTNTGGRRRPSRNDTAPNGIDPPSSAAELLAFMRATATTKPRATLSWLPRSAYDALEHLVRVHGPPKVKAVYRLWTLDQQPWSDLAAGCQYAVGEFADPKIFGWVSSSRLAGALVAKYRNEEAAAAQLGLGQTVGQTLVSMLKPPGS